MVEKDTAKAEKLISIPEDKLHPLPHALLLKIRTGLPYTYQISHRLHTGEGAADVSTYWQDTVPKDVTRMSAFMAVPGFGCNTITTESGREVSYFSWLFDELRKVKQNEQDQGRAPPVMHSFCWPGSHMTVQEAQKVQKSFDPYSIKYQPAIFMQMLDQFVANTRAVLPNQVRELDATVLSHSMGARAAIQAFHNIGQIDDGKELKKQIDLLAQRNGFDKVHLNAIFMAPAFGLAPAATKMLRVFQPMEIADKGMEKLAKHVPITGSIFNAYRALSENSFRATLRYGLDAEIAQFYTGLTFDDPTGFLRYFPDNNNPHILVRQGHEIMTRSRGIDVFSLDNIGNTAGINMLAVSHGADNFVDTQWATHTFGAPSHASEDTEWHNPTHVLSSDTMTHTECLQNPRLIAEIVTKHMNTPQDIAE